MTLTVDSTACQHTPPAQGTCPLRGTGRLDISAELSSPLHAPHSLAHTHPMTGERGHPHQRPRQQQVLSVLLQLPGSAYKRLQPPDVSKVAGLPASSPFLSLLGSTLTLSDPSNRKSTSHYYLLKGHQWTYQPGLAP